MNSLADSTMKELRTALIEQLANPDNPTPALTRQLQRVAKEARERNIRPEELIIVFKQLWNSLAETLRPQSAEQYERVRQRLVTLSIQAYYSEQD